MKFIFIWSPNYPVPVPEASDHLEVIAAWITSRRAPGRDWWLPDVVGHRAGACVVPPGRLPRGAPAPRACPAPGRVRIRDHDPAGDPDRGGPAGSGSSLGCARCLRARGLLPAWWSERLPVVVVGLGVAPGTGRRGVWCGGARRRWEAACSSAALASSDRGDLVSCLRCGDLLCWTLAWMSCSSSSGTRPGASGPEALLSTLSRMSERVQRGSVLGIPG